MRKFDLQELKTLSGAAVLLILFLMPVAVGQQPPATRKADKANTRVRVKQNGGYFLSVRAKEVPLSQIADELSRRLKAPVIVSRVMSNQKVTLDFQDLPLETALQMMAPVPYVHYELLGGGARVCREVFLNAFNEPIPAPKLENRNISFVMQGNTESESEEDPLQVNYKNELLSVSVKKQSLTAVLDRIATVIGVNFTMKEDSAETIDLNFKETSLENAMSYFPPSVHLHVRKDLQRHRTLPLLVEFANNID